MTVKRDKQNRRVLRYYRIAFGIEAPYSVLVDGNFLHAAGGKNLEVEERLQKLLNSRKVNVLVTRCTCHELQALGEACGAAAAYASTLKRQKCGHPREPEGAGDCIASLVGEELLRLAASHEYPLPPWALCSRCRPWPRPRGCAAAQSPTSATLVGFRSTAPNRAACVPWVSVWWQARRIGTNMW